MFEKEKERFNSMIDALRTEVERLEPQPISVWIFGKIAYGEDEYGDPLQIAILGDLKGVDAITNQLREQLLHNKVESKFDVTIDLRGVVKADIETRPTLTEGEIILFWGMDPRTFLEQYIRKNRSIKSHHDFDATSIEEAKAWSELLKNYPEIIPRTVSYLNEQIHHTGSGEKKELMEWRQLLESGSYQRLKKFLESDSERSIRLRQSLPFWSVLKKNERKKFEKLRSPKV